MRAVLSIKSKNVQPDRHVLLCIKKKSWNFVYFRLSKLGLIDHVISLNIVLKLKVEDDLFLWAICMRQPIYQLLTAMSESFPMLNQNSFEDVFESKLFLIVKAVYIFHLLLSLFL